MSISQEQPAPATMPSSPPAADNTDSKPNRVVQAWQRLTAVIHRAISGSVLSLAMVSARNPKRTIALITFVSGFLAIVGLLTNFNIQTDYEVVYAPYGSQPIKDKEWIDNESGFPATPKPITVLLHDNGQNVLGMEQVDTLFEALDTIRGTPGYNELCQQSTYRNPQGDPDCQIYGATRFWGHSRETFQKQIDSDEAAIEVLSAETFPGGVPVFGELTFGHAERGDGGNTTEGELGLLNSVKSLILRVNLPAVDGVEDFQVDVLDRMLDLKNRIDDNPESTVELEFFSMLSYNLEFERAIEEDMILVPFVVLIMSAFTCVVFYRKDRVQSRCLLGLCSVVAVGLCLATGFGLMFIIGVPFTSMTQLLPFIVFGVGLDDCFIIMGAYCRTSPQKEPIERVRETMKEVGRSIALTSITTLTAFLLGCMSSIPAVRWVCIYAVPTVILNFVYQCSFFISCLVLDEERIVANRRDFCFCCIAAENEEKVSEHELVDNEVDDNNTPDEKAKKRDGKDPEPTLRERAMSCYATHLVKPWVKIVVMVAFAAYLGFCIYCATNLKQRFRTSDFVPEDSYVSEFLAAWRPYSEQVMGINVYFRDVNQSDPEIQQQMRDYMDDLSEMDAVNGTEPPLCWVTDFQALDDDPRLEAFKNLSFSEKVTLALTNPSIKEGYGNDIVQDENGTIVASRCWLNPRYLSLQNVREQIDALQQQREISLAQPINEDSDDQLKFFTFEDLYYLWSFYEVAVQELINTTISGIVAVCVVGFVLIEHRSAIAFVLPMIVILYVDLLGTLQYAGLYINVVTYVCMVISIGLLVDFLMHVILKYYESPGATRDEKVKYTLETMGASIFVGGFSTFLGVIPLAFSTSAILRTVCTAFFSMVVLGLTHGLILLPVVLSLVGPIIRLEPQQSSTDGAEPNNTPQSPTSTVGTTGVSMAATRMTDDDDAHSISTDESASPKKSSPPRVSNENDIES